MNWFWLGSALVVSGIVTIIMARKKQDKQSNKMQTGYLLTLFGLFTIIAQYLSIGDTMFIFVLFTGAVVLVNRIIGTSTQKTSKISLVTFSKEFFPILLVVFLIRGFLVEPFQIPSSSMRPGLIAGDFILVNKFNYGLRAPFSNKVFYPIALPRHNDVLVFNYPNDPKINYIKRVIGLPGDVVRYVNKQLTINGQIVQTVNLRKPYHYLSEENDKSVWTDLYQETFANKSHIVLQEKSYPTLFLGNVQEFPYRENCQYDENGFQCTVPKGHYFVMGDNRDHSGDSRYWGFVAEDYIVGRAFFVWLNLKNFSRIGTKIQ